MVQDPYSILGVPQGASQDEIKKAYRKKCKEYHPDLHPGDAVAARKMAEVNEAYDMLQNPEKYAKQRQQQSSRSQSGYGQSGYGQNSYGGYRQGNQQSDRGYQGAGGWYSDFGGFDFDDFFGFGGSESSGPSRPQHESGDTLEFRRAIDAINARQYQQAIMILEDDYIKIPAGEENDYRWISDGDDWSHGYSKLRKAPEKSFAFSRTGQMRSTAVLADVPVLSVASGAVLRIEGDDSVPAPCISKIAVDASAGFGKVFGAAFSGSGSIEIRNVPENLPVSFSFAQGDVEGLANLKDWAISFAGDVSGRLVAAISSDGSSLTVSNRGLSVVIR